MSKLPPLPHWCESGSPFAEQMQAYATAATEPLLQRIAELEQRNRDLYEDVQRFRKHAMNEKAARMELERKSDQDDETIIWQAKEISEKTDKLEELERQLEEARKDAERYLYIRSGNVYIEPNIDVIYMATDSGGKYYKDARDMDMDIDDAIDAAMQKG